MAMPANGRRNAVPPKFVTGSLLGHVLNMTGAGAFGLMAIFAGDLANIYFLSALGDEAVVAAAGYASSILFLSTSIGIGLSIAATALIAPAIGAGFRPKARRLSTHAHALSFLISAVLSVALWLAIAPLLRMMGAEGRALDLGVRYLTILLPTLPMLSLGLTSSAVLRSVGDARRAMHITMVSAIVNTILDVILIVYLGYGIEGAAVASFIARIGIMAIGFYGVSHVHRLLGRVRRESFLSDARAFSTVAVPAVLTNIATPAGNAYVTYAVAAFGDGAVAGWAIIGRIMPVAFGAIYALSGSVGPIIGQNFGARRPDRMRGVLSVSLWTMVAFTLAAWAILAVSADWLSDQFRAGQEARILIVFFCRWVSPLFVFLGALFIANAVFNTLGRAHFSTILNWGRATLGTVPFVALGADYASAPGVLFGQMLGAAPFALVAVVLAYQIIAKYGEIVDQ